MDVCAALGLAPDDVLILFECTAADRADILIFRPAVALAGVLSGGVFFGSSVDIVDDLIKLCREPTSPADEAILRVEHTLHDVQDMLTHASMAAVGTVADGLLVSAGRVDVPHAAGHGGCSRLSLPFAFASPLLSTSREHLHALALAALNTVGTLGGAGTLDGLI